jgi:uncharacterized protein DUF29
VTHYEKDFFQWTQETARAIEEGRFDEIDRTALADEVEGLGKRDRREVGRRFAVILLHLLKLKYQPDKESGSWHSTIATQRRELESVLEDSPSLRPHVAALLPKAYGQARIDAANETGIDIDTFPETCEWTITEVLGESSKG